jgi:energy-coupling factor transporter ATP-binding protein EcfA2
MGTSNKYCPDHLPGPRQRKTGPGILLLFVPQITDTYTFLQVRGTPGSGKTTLLKLLRNLILKEEEGAQVHVISNWFDIDTTPESQYNTRLNSRVPGLLDQSHEITSKTFILFDNGQDTYWDEQLWEIFLKDHQQRPNGFRIILFSTYGSPTKRPVSYPQGIPPIVPPRARISLRRQNHSSIGEPVGLLLTREEFDDVVQRADKVILDPYFQDFIFESTDGHVGAVICILEALSFQVSGF